MCKLTEYWASKIRGLMWSLRGGSAEISCGLEWSISGGQFIVWRSEGGRAQWPDIQLIASRSCPQPTSQCRSLPPNQFQPCLCRAFLVRSPNCLANHGVGLQILCTKTKDPYQIWYKTAIECKIISYVKQVMQKNESCKPYFAAYISTVA